MSPTVRGFAAAVVFVALLLCNGVVAALDRGDQPDGADDKLDEFRLPSCSVRL